MPAKSKAQRRFMAMAEHGAIPESKMPDMTKAQMRDFAATPESGLPEHASKPREKKRMHKRFGGHKHSDVTRGRS